MTYTNMTRNQTQLIKVTKSIKIFKIYVPRNTNQHIRIWVYGEIRTGYHTEITCRYSIREQVRKDTQQISWRTSTENFTWIT